MLLPHANGGHYEQLNPQLRMLDDEAIYVQTYLYPWSEARRRCYLHIFFNPQHMMEDRVDFDLHILQLEHELVEHELMEVHVEQYRQFFIVKETPKGGRKVIRNAEAAVCPQIGQQGHINGPRNAIMGPEKVGSSTIFRSPKIYQKCFPLESNFIFWRSCMDYKKVLRLHYVNKTQ